MSSFSFWEWLDISGLLIVTLGCAGECWLLFKPAPFNPTQFGPLEHAHKKFEKACVVAIVIGLAFELVALPISLGQSHREITDLTNENLKQLAKIEELRKTNLELEALVSPRTLSLDQQNRISSQLSKFAGKKVDIVSYALDAEGARVLLQLSSVFANAKIYNVVWPGQRMTTGGFETGISVRGDQSQSEFINAITNALISIGNLEAAANPPSPKTSVFMGGFETGTNVTISVGVKPIPTQTIRAGT